MKGPVIKYFLTNPFQVMTYLVIDPATKEAMVIDPAGALRDIIQEVEENKLTIKWIFLTHCHVDHLLELREFKETFAAPAAMHRLDLGLLKEGYDSLFGDITHFQMIPIEIQLEDNQLLGLGSMELRVIHTPGHTPGSICILIDGNLFTGDTLFVGAVGRTDLKGGSFEELLRSIKEKLLPLPEDTVIWPGHDYGDTPTSTMGREKAENPYITDFLL